MCERIDMSIMCGIIVSLKFNSFPISSLFFSASIGHDLSDLDKTPWKRCSIAMWMVSLWLIIVFVLVPVYREPGFSWRLEERAHIRSPSHTADKRLFSFPLSLAFHKNTQVLRPIKSNSFTIFMWVTMLECKARLLNCNSII